MYVSSRDKTASYTAYRTLHEDTAPDGGVYVPFKWPSYAPEKLCRMQENTFAQNVAQVLNDFFGTSLTDRDVALCIGKNTVQMKNIGHRLVVYELWHNPEGDHSQLERALHRRLYHHNGDTTPTRWSRIAIRIALLFGIFLQLQAAGIGTANLVTTSTDPVGLCAAIFARRSGLPIGDIIYCSTNESSMWDFLAHGTLNTGMPHDSGMEWLLHALLGEKEAERYWTIATTGGTYSVDEEHLQYVSDGIIPEVVGDKRIYDTIRSVYRTNRYVLGEETALAFGGQQDHRAHTGETGNTLMLSLRSPANEQPAVCAALGITPEEFSELKKNF